MVLCICKDKTYTQRKITALHVPNVKKEAGTISLPLPISVSVLFC
mgnify:FL=1